MIKTLVPKCILLTGGAGFIGSHTALVLLKKGYSIIIVDSLINSKKSSINRIKEIVKKECPQYLNNISSQFGDLRDIKFIESVFLKAQKNNQNILGVIHFAGLKSVGESIKNPLLYWDANLVGSINLFRVMERYNCKSIIFSSSATIYDSCTNNISENYLINPINPYGTTKVAIEQLLTDIYNSNPNSWKIINLRYFNPIGAHPSGFLGEDPKGIPTNIFPIILKVASKELKNISIFGSDWNTKDGTGVRDYIHVCDLAEGHVLALEFLIKSQNQIVNINMGTGKGTTVLELIKTFEKVNKVKVPYIFAEKRSGDSGFAVADNSLMKELLNWKPSRNIDDMCRDGWHWKENNNKSIL